MGISPDEPEYFLPRLLTLGHQVQELVMAARARGTDMSAVDHESAADTSYAIDAAVDPALTEACRRWSAQVPIVLVAEGLHDEKGVEGAQRFGGDGPGVRIIVDPIDGTRGLMYDKRSAWFLAGVAPDRGPGTSLRDIVAAVQVEIGHPI